MSSKRKKKHLKKGMPPETLVYTGNREQVIPEVNSIWFNEEHIRCQRNKYAPESIRNEESGVTWIDIKGLADVTLVEKAGLDMGIHPLALEDVLNTQQRAKYEDFDNGIFFIANNLKINPELLTIEKEQIAFFCGKNFVISYQEDADDTFHEIIHRLEENRGRLRKKGADFLLYSLLDLVVDNYYTVLNELDSAMEDLEEHMHHEQDLPVVKIQIFRLKHAVNNFKRYVLPMRDAVSRLYRSDHENIDDSNSVYFRDVADHVIQILDHTDNLRDNLNSILELYQSEVGNRLNSVMRVLTVISTIFMPLSFLAGVYGMNFDNMPELHWHYGYFLCLGAMFAVFVGFLIYFRRKNWL